MRKLYPLLLIAGILVISGCAQEGPESKDPIKILEQATDNILVNDFSGTYNLESALTADIKSTGTINLKVKGGNIYARIRVTDAKGALTEVVQLFLTEGKTKGMFTCGEVKQGQPPVCLKQSGASFDQVNFKDQVKSFLEKARSGEMEVTYLGTETIAGRVCDNLKLKLKQDIVKDAGSEMCFDRKTGYQLRQQTKAAGTSTTMVLSEFGPPPTDADFALPYEVELS